MCVQQTNSEKMKPNCYDIKMAGQKHVRSCREGSFSVVASLDHDQSAHCVNEMKESVRQSRARPAAGQPINILCSYCAQRPEPV